MDIFIKTEINGEIISQQQFETSENKFFETLSDFFYETGVMLEEELQKQLFRNAAKSTVNLQKIEVITYTRITFGDYLNQKGFLGNCLISFPISLHPTSTESTYFEAVYQVKRNFHNHVVKECKKFFALNHA